MSPSKGLADKDFLDWATDNYSIDGGFHEVIPRTLSLNELSCVARSSHEKRSGAGRPQLCQVRQVHPDREAMVMSRSGLARAAGIRTRRQVKRFTLQWTCRHQLLDHRGRSNFIARFFCKQREIFADGMPHSQKLEENVSWERSRGTSFICSWHP